MKELVRHYAGSIAYGTNLPDSDVDIRGIFISGKDNILTPYHPWDEQELVNEEDGKLYELGKFTKLYTDGNPNIMDTLWVDPQHIISTGVGYNMLRDQRSNLLSKKLAFTFSGYAMSQLKRIKGHNKWINRPQPKDPIRQFEYIKLVQNFTEAKIFASDWSITQCNEGYMMVPYGGNTYGVVERTGATCLTRTGDIRMYKHEDIPDEIKKRPPVFIVKYLAEEHVLAKDTRTNYWKWRDNRNEKRSELEAKFGYDCYLDSETEFLTKDGWRKYDNVEGTDLMATVNPVSKAIEFQPFSERVKKEYTGEIYRGETQDTAFAVTGNHRMFTSPCSRSTANNFSTAFNPDTSEWTYSSLTSLIDSNKSYYHVLTGVRNDQKDYDIADDTLVLIGCYLSDGCLIKRPSGKLKGVSISQLEGGRLQSYIESISTWDVIMHPHTRNGRQENTYNVYNPGIAEWLQEMCGEYSKTKRLPSFISMLSERQAGLLLDTMMAGDGTHRPKSDVYYTASPEMSNGVQYLAILAGRVAKKWEYIPKGSCDQIYVSKKDITQVISTTQHVSVGTVLEEDGDHVVCFTVPNENLITRRLGKVAIQGNTKHAMHLVRLMRMGEEILTTGKVNVFRPDAKELLGIRAGEWDYEDLVAYATEKDDLVRNVLYKSSDLPHRPDLGLATQLLIDIREAIWYA